MTIVSLSGIGAFDNVSRAAFLDKMVRTPSLHSLVPFALALYGSPSLFLWTNDGGNDHTIIQAEGGEQGCPLMLAFYALAQHDALAAADGNLLPDEYVFAFLGDIYTKTSPGRATNATLLVTTTMERHAGVRSHYGKLRM